MGRAPCCDKGSVKRGPWSPEEDEQLRSYVRRHGIGGNWIALPQKAGTLHPAPASSALNEQRSWGEWQFRADFLKQFSISPTSYLWSSGLNRCGKSCRLRWLNYLRPDIKHGGYTEQEDRIILSLYSSIGSRWVRAGSVLTLTSAIPATVRACS